MIDLATNGVTTTPLTRRDINAAIGRIILSAIRSGWAYSDLFALLTDITNRKLAKQLTIGKGGRPIPDQQRNTWIWKQWERLTEYAATHPAWDATDVPDALAYVRDQFDQARADLTERDAAIIETFIDLGDHYGTLRPVGPVRTIATATGLTIPTAHRSVMRICEQGEWLQLSQRGSRCSGRANLYRLAPKAVETYMRTRTPTSQSQTDSPMSHSDRHSPMSHQTDEGIDMNNPVTLTVQARDIAHLLEVLTSQGVAVDPQQLPANVVPIRKWTQ
jgi:hypothetical protein